MNSPPRDSGSKQPEFRYIAIGRVVRAHGIKGEISVAVMTDFPERFGTTEWVYLGNETEAEPYRIISHRWHKSNVLLTLEAVPDRTTAEALQGLWVQVPIEAVTPLPDGSYYLYQLVGLEVVTINGQYLGELTDILETKANDVYIIKAPDQPELLLPAIPDVIQEVDLENGRMTVKLLEGLI
jgi:16S rRNA processing protein RimM